MTGKDFEDLNWDLPLIIPFNYSIQIHAIIYALASISNIERFMSNINNLEELQVNKLALSAVLYQFVQLIENLNRIPDRLRKLCDGITIPLVKWREIPKFRIFLIHKFWDLDLGIVWESINIELPPLKYAMNILFQTETYAEGEK